MRMSIASRSAADRAVAMALMQEFGMSLKDVALELRFLERANGVLIPEDVVRAAQPPESPLHNHFTWDDSEAAHKQRIHEARTLIRTVKVEITVREVPLTVCGYIRDPEADAGQAGYRNITVVRSEEDLARAAIVDEMKRVSNAVGRAKRLALTLGVQDDVNHIDELARSVTTRVTNNDSVHGRAA